MTGHERNIIDNEFSDMEEIDTKDSIKHNYKDKSRKREDLAKKRRRGNKKSSNLG
jgi:polyphosphate kinase